MSVNNIPEILTVKEATHVSRLCRTTIWKAIKQGKLKKCANTGIRVLIAHDELRRFLGINDSQQSQKSEDQTKKQP